MRAAVAPAAARLDDTDDDGGKPYCDDGGKSLSLVTLLCVCVTSFENKQRVAKCRTTVLKIEEKEL